METVRHLQIIPESRDPLQVLVQIRLAEQVPACCTPTDGSFIVFKGDTYLDRKELEFIESKKGHRLEARVRLPAPGTYSYRLVAKIMGDTWIREGTYIAR